jgi:predicted anti-sigma-YlaC factor YlaD
MSLFHGAAIRRARLLASGDLEGKGRAAVELHLRACPACREEFDSVKRLLGLVAQDAGARAELPISTGALLTRVLARLGEAEAPPRRPLWLIPVATAAVVLLAVLYHPVERSAPEVITISAASLRRIERNMARDQTARYLSAAGDVLVNVAAAPQKCRKREGRLDVGQEARKSQELLSRKALLVEMTDDQVASARPVLEDVDQLLLRVASLDPCARPGDVETIQRELYDHHLLMRINLMTQELEG